MYPDFPLLTTFFLQLQILTSILCKLQFMVIDFLVLMIIVFNSSFIQSNTPAPYLIMPIVYAFIPAVTFRFFNFDLSNFFTLQVYSLDIFFYS